MSSSDIPGFDAAQAAYENQHPNDGICPCHAEHENCGCDGGYKLGSSGSYTCDHEACHSEDSWWAAREFIEGGFIKNEIELTFVVEFINQNPDPTGSEIEGALSALDSAQHHERIKPESRFSYGFRSSIIGIEEVVR